jgi:uncharacterized protein YcfL
MKIFHSLNPIKKGLRIVILFAILLQSLGMSSSSEAQVICYTLTTILKGGGAVTPSPAPNCSSGGAFQYTSGTVVQLTAFPNSNYSFGGWSGDLSGTTNPQSLPMSANKSVTAKFPPTNDNIANARLIDSITYIDSLDTRAATQPGSDPDAISCTRPAGPVTLNAGLHTVWYTYTPTAVESIALDTLGSDYDTFIAVWSGSPGSLSPVACNDDTFEAIQSELSFLAGAGTTYYIEIAAGNGLEGEPIPPEPDLGALQFHAYITNTNIFISGVLQGKYYVPPSGSLRRSFAGINNGPVGITNDASTNIIAAERVIYTVNGVRTSFSEIMALPNSQLNTTYWLPWYNNVDLDTQLRFGNVSGSPATIRVYIGGVEISSCTSIPNTPYPYTLANGASIRVSCAGKNAGPVKIEGTGNIVAAERVIYTVNGVRTSFSEMMALPNSQLNTTYWLPWYNNVDLDTQLRFGNVSGSPATIRVYIGGVEISSCTSIPNTPYPYTLANGASIRVSCAGINNGLVKIEGTGNIVAAERVIYNVNGTNTSFSEMMALPNSQLNTTYWLPWYNNVDLDTQLRFGNVSGSPATIRVYIGGVEISSCTSIPNTPYPYTLANGASIRVSCAGINNGLVKIEGTGNIVAAERVIYNVNGTNTSFSEMMALANSQLDDIFRLPWYNNVDLDTQLRFGVP